MKTTTQIIGAISTVTQSKWIRPALIALALVAVLLGLTGCPDHPH